MAQASLPLQCPSHCNSSKFLREDSVGSGLRGQNQKGHTNSPGDWHADSVLREPPVQKAASIPSPLALHEMGVHHS